MCGEHRSVVIKEIKRKLKAGEPVQVISTQLVEAGVDLDFPVVYRALAGFDSGTSGRSLQPGRASWKRAGSSFVPPKAPPKGMLLLASRRQRASGMTIRVTLPPILCTPRYFEQYFGAEDPDKHCIRDLLERDALQIQIQFRSAAEKFQLIDDKSTTSILVPYNARAEGLIGFVAKGEHNRGILRQLQRFSVTVYEHEFVKLRDIGAIEEVQPDLW